MITIINCEMSIAFSVNASLNRSKSWVIFEKRESLLSRVNDERSTLISPLFSIKRRFPLLSNTFIVENRSDFLEQRAREEKSNKGEARTYVLCLGVRLTVMKMHT